MGDERAGLLGKVRDLLIARVTGLGEHRRLQTRPMKAALADLPATDRLNDVVDVSRLGIGQFRDADDVTAGLEDKRPNPKRTHAMLDPPAVCVENRAARQRSATGGQITGKTANNVHGSTVPAERLRLPGSGALSPSGHSERGLLLRPAGDPEQKPLRGEN